MRRRCRLCEEGTTRVGFGDLGMTSFCFRCGVAWHSGKGEGMLVRDEGTREVTGEIWWPAPEGLLVVGWRRRRRAGGKQ